MTRFLIAAAAITACCMGNQYPARSHHNHGPSEGYAVGAVYGATCSALLGYTTEQQSAVYLLATLQKRDMSASDVTPRISALASELYEKDKCQTFKKEMRNRAAASYAL